VSHDKTFISKFGLKDNKMIDMSSVHDQFIIIYNKKYNLQLGEYGHVLKPF